MKSAVSESTLLLPRKSRLQLAEPLLFRWNLALGEVRAQARLLITPSCGQGISGRAGGTSKRPLKCQPVAQGTSREQNSASGHLVACQLFTPLWPHAGANGPRVQAWGMRKAGFLRAAGQASWRPGHHSRPRETGLSFTDCSRPEASAPWQLLAEGVQVRAEWARVPGRRFCRGR